MTRFSPSDAALEGFRLTWERPGAVLVWALVRFVFGFIGVALFIAQGGAEAVSVLSATSDPASLAPDVAARMLAHVAPGLGALFLVNTAGYALVYAAVLRAVLTPEAKGLGALRFGRDEALQFLVALAVSAMVFVYAVGAGLVSGLVGAAPEPIGHQLRGAVFVASSVCLLTIFVRLSLAPARTFDDARVRLTSAASQTRGLFWPIFLAFLLAAALAAVVVILTGVILTLVIGAVGLGVGGQRGLTAAVAAIGYTPGSVRDLLDPRTFLYLGVSSLLATLSSVLLMAAAAAIYRAVRQQPLEPRRAPSTSGRPWG